MHGEGSWVSPGSDEAHEALFRELHANDETTVAPSDYSLDTEKLTTLPFDEVFHMVHIKREPRWTVSLDTVRARHTLGSRTNAILGGISLIATTKGLLRSYFDYAEVFDGLGQSHPRGLIVDKLPDLGELLRSRYGREIPNIGADAQARLIDLSGKLFTKFITERPLMTDEETRWHQRIQRFY